jgi:hypothetical protein
MKTNILKILATLLALIQGKRLTSKTYTYNPVWFEDFSRFLDAVGLTVATVFTPSQMRPGRYYVTLSVSL